MLITTAIKVSDSVESSSDSELLLAIERLTYRGLKARTGNTVHDSQRRVYVCMKEMQTRGYEQFNELL